MAGNQSKTGVEGSDPTDTAGNGSDGAADPAKEVEGLKAALKAEREKRQAGDAKLARLEGTVEGLKSGQQPPKTENRIYTRAELRTHVEAGKISEDQMDAILESQLEAKLKAEIENKTRTATAVSARDQKISNDLISYTEANPELLDPESDLRAKVQREFDYLVDLGDDPKDRATELKAVRAALGTLAPRGRRKTPESHQEVGGAGDDDHSSSSNDWSAGLTLSSKEKAHYQKMIDRGIYKGEAGQKALQAELKTFRRGKAN